MKITNIVFKDGLDVRIEGTEMIVSPKPDDKETYTMQELRNLADVNQDEYQTEDAIWKVDRIDKESGDNQGTVLVTASGIRLKRQYEGSVQSDWFKGWKTDNTALLNYLFSQDFDLDLNAGVYEIDPVAGDNLVIYGRLGGTITFNKDAYIKAKPTLLGGRDDGVSILSIGWGTKNFTLNNPRIVGDKHERSEVVHGEWYKGITIGNIEDSEINDLHITEMWGDGIGVAADHMGGKWKDLRRCNNVTLNNPFIDDVGRNGISLSASKNLHIKGGYIARADRVSPRSGIDFETEPSLLSYGPWGNDPIIGTTMDGVEICNNGLHGIILFSHTGDVDMNNMNIHSNVGYGMTSRHANGKQSLRNSKVDGLLLHKMWKGQEFLVENSEIENVSMQNNIGGKFKFINSKLGNVIVKWWESGSLEMKNVDTKIFRILDLVGGDVHVDKAKIDATGFRGAYALKIDGKIDKVTVENSEITGANYYKTTSGVLVDENMETSNRENVKIINNKLYNNSNNARIEADIVFEGNKEL